MIEVSMFALIVSGFPCSRLIPVLVVPLLTMLVVRYCGMRDCGLERAQQPPLSPPPGSNHTRPHPVHHLGHHLGHPHTADLGTTQHRVAIWGFGGFGGSKVVWFSVKGGVLEQELGAGWLVCSGAQPMRGRPAPTQIADASMGGRRGGVG